MQVSDDTDGSTDPDAVTDASDGYNPTALAFQADSGPYATGYNDALPIAYRFVDAIRTTKPGSASYDSHLGNYDDLLREEGERARTVMQRLGPDSPTSMQALGRYQALLAGRGAGIAAAHGVE